MCLTWDKKMHFAQPHSMYFLKFFSGSREKHYSNENINHSERRAVCERSLKTGLSKSPGTSFYFFIPEMFNLFYVHQKFTQLIKGKVQHINSLCGLQNFFFIYNILLLFSLLNKFTS